MTDAAKRATAFAAAVALALTLCAPAFAYDQQEDIVSSGHGSNSAQYLVIHETANPGASAYNHTLLWSRDDTYAVHYVMELDGSVVYHTVPDWTLCWHVGNGNYATVGIELAHATNSADFNKQWGEAVKWAGDYLNQRGWGIDRLLSHNDCRYIWGGTDHTDPTGYFASYGKSWADFKAAVREYMATGQYSGNTTAGDPTPQQPATKPATPAGSSNVTYAAFVNGYGWLDDVTNSGTGSEGFAGIPYEPMRYITMSVDAGSVRYRVHTQASGWLDWVYESDKSDYVYGAAGDGSVIDGLQAYYTSDGSNWYQVYYRAQDVDHAGYWDTVCDDGTTYGGDWYAGCFGSGMDRLQAEISDDWPAMVA